MEILYFEGSSFMEMEIGEVVYLRMHICPDTI